MTTLTSLAPTAAVKAPARIRKPNPITQTLIGWHNTTHDGDFIDCQEQPCLLVAGARALHTCACKRSKPGSDKPWDDSTCLTCNDTLWLGKVDTDTIVAAVRLWHELDEHRAAHFFCAQEPCLSVERNHFFAGYKSVPKLRR